MNHKHVVAAIIHDSENRIFATQRASGEWKDWWEFPGGKIEPGETPEEALKREIWEELETHIAIEHLVTTVEWDYPKFHLTMHCYWCHVESGELVLKEHESARWLKPDELDSVQWLPADWEVIEMLKENAMNIAIYTLTSALHDPQAIDMLTKEFLTSLNVPYILKGDDFSDYGSHDLNLIFVRTGGTEGLFQQLMPALAEKSDAPFYLLASDKSNSLAASLEILSYLRQQGKQGEILHGNPEYVASRIQLLGQVESAVKRLRHCRLGVIGKPSDWLIASHSDAECVRQKLGAELLEIPMSELLDTLTATPEPSPTEHSDMPAVNEALSGACRIYEAMKTIVQKRDLQGFTIRCFDLLDAVHNTGCLALAKLNAEGYIAGCEGDVPTMLTMTLLRALSGTSSFQANPASIDPETGEILFAHCTIPFDMVQRYELDTHFESGIGVGIRGYVPEGPVTICKVSGDLSRAFIAEGKLVRSQAKPDLCRTQIVVRLANPSDTEYFLTNPIGNHHVIVVGHHTTALKALLQRIRVF